MGFLSRRRSPARAQWLPICSSVAKGLAEIRDRWCVMAAAALEADSTETSRRMSVETENALRAYQLEFCTAILARKQYVERRDGQDFADILFGCVCGAELERTMTLLRRYHDAPDNSAQMARFSRDVSRGIRGDDPPTVASLLRLQAIMPNLIFATLTTIAEVFEDKEEMRSLEEAFAKLAKGANL